MIHSFTSCPITPPREPHLDLASRRRERHVTVGHIGQLRLRLLGQLREMTTGHYETLTELLHAVKLSRVGFDLGQENLQKHI